MAPIPLRLLPRRGLAALALAAWAALSLSGCDQQRTQRLESGVSTEADVRREFGEPAQVNERADGSKVLEYPRQPEGVTNLKITVDAAGKLVVIRQQLTPETFAEVQPGMDQKAVRELLGKPAAQRRYDLKPDETFWDWRYEEPGGKRKVFSVQFDRGLKVVKTESGDDPRDTQIGGK